MTVSKPVHEWSASEIARAIRERRITSVEATTCFLERIRALNPRINAVVALREDEALAEARAADLAVQRLAPGGQLGPLHGVPVTIKDIHRVAGSPSTYGFPQYRNHVPVADCWSVAQVRRAGAVILGRTNVPVGGFDWQCWNPVYGRTLNPWNTGHTCGGSSGGAAAAVSARLAPLELGSDIAGSIRYPAHCCGILGLRPTDGRVPNWMVGPEDLPTVFRHVLTSGPMSRSFDDLELGLEVLSPGGARFPEIPKRPLRIAWSESLAGFEKLRLDEESRVLFKELRARLASAGHELVETAPDGIDFGEATELWGEIAGFEFIAALPRPLLWLGGRFLMSLGLPRLLYGDSRLARGLERGLRAGPRRYFELLCRKDELMMKYQRFAEGHDFWITPAAPGAAIATRRFGKRFRGGGLDHSYSEYLSGLLAGLGASGHPIVAAPIGMTASGLPVGAQFHGARNLDEKLLRDLRAVESLLPAFSAPPGFG